MLAAGSMVVLVVSVCGWVRSSRVSESLMWAGRETLGVRVAGVLSWDGKVAVHWQEDAFHGGTAQYAWPAVREQPAWMPGLFWERHGDEPLDGVVMRTYEDRWGLRTFDLVRASAPYDVRVPWYPWTGYVRRSVRAVVVPWWVIVLASAVLPAARVRQVLRDRRRAKWGLCRACGYDLRASEGRCPECGEGRGSDER